MYQTKLFIDCKSRELVQSERGSPSRRLRKEKENRCDCNRTGHQNPNKVTVERFEEKVTSPPPLPVTG